MAPATDIRQQVFDLLSRASNLSFVTTDREPGAVSRLSPGQQVNAEVLAALPNNRVQVRVGTERFNLDLPMAVRPGQTLEMTFVSETPRSTFAIARQGGAPPPVSLSDASRLLSLLVTGEQIADPALRSSLQSIGNMLRRSSGETPVLASLLDEALTYGSRKGAAEPSPSLSSRGENLKSPLDQSRLSAFETSAGNILKNIAQNARFTLLEAANQPLTTLPLLPGDEINAKIVGTLPGGRSFVQVAGTNLELLLPHKAAPGEILRLTFLSAEPKPTFALSRLLPESPQPLLSEAGRWLSVLEHSEGGVSRQQSYVLERLNSVLKNLPPNSPAFSAISEEALTYQRSSRPPAADVAAAAALASAAPNVAPRGNGIELSDDMARLLQAVIRGNRLAILELLNQQAPAGSFMPGQQLRGEVLAALGGGRFTVQVAGQMLEFTMPRGVRRGDLINLFFISEEPRQTFLMVRFGRHGDSRVSETGRWLSGFISETSANVPAQSTLGILKTLLGGPTTDAALLGRVLQQGMRESGLFYESHLARWFGGDFPLSDLLKEPQGRLSPRLVMTGTLPALPADELAGAGLKSGLAGVMETVFKNAATPMKHEGIAEQRALPIINEQLTALQSGQLVFRGDLFPGQRLEWSVTERDAGRNQSGERERSWDTSITINLPHLGEVSAKITLEGTRVGVAVSVGADSTATVLEGGRLRLVEQFEAAGLTAAEVSIGHVPE